ncbi:TPA: hypothetical protein ACH3X3_010928 [Trebouxia sp. C0006]
MASELGFIWLNCEQVLGHHLSKGATALFQTAQATASWSVNVLPSLEEDNTMHKLRPEIEHNIERYLMRHMHGQALTMGNLPEDPPIVNGVKTVQIKKNDYHKGLVPKQDNAVHATHPLPAGRAIDAYAAELAPPPQKTWGKKLLREVFDMALQGQQLVCSGFGCSNMLACINDGRADPMSPEASKRDRAANVQLLPVAVCRWPFLFMITSEDVTPGELYLDYGRGFWDIQRDRLMEIEAWQRELDKVLQRERQLQRSRGVSSSALQDTASQQAARSRAGSKRPRQSCDLKQNSASSKQLCVRSACCGQLTGIAA